MPDQSSHLTDLLKGGHNLRCFMSIFRGRLVMEGVIADVPFAHILISFTVTSGDVNDVRPGFRVDFYTAAGAFKGRTRLSYNLIVTSSSVFIRELSPGSIDVQAGDIVRIYREVRLSDKLPIADASFSPDGLPYTDQGSAPPPLACSGGAWAGWTRQLPVLMTGTSPLVDPDSSTPPTHVWDSDGLSFASGTSTSVSPSLTGTQGSCLVAHEVTDPDNGNDITQYVPVVIHDKTHPPYKVIIEDLPNEETRGGTARVRMLETVLLSDVPDGSLIILWKEEFIAGTRQSFGAASPGRSHILFVGYLRSESGEGSGETGAETLTFEIISALARLDELMGYGKVMLNDATPDAWDKVKSLTMVRGLIQIPMFYSNLIESGHDLIFTDSVVDYDYPGLFADQTTPLQQIRKLADGIDCRLIEDRRGRFEVQMRPELSALADRASLPITLTLQAKMVKSWRYTRQHWRPVNRLQCNGFVAGYSSNPVVFSEWPGSSPSEGNQTSTVEGLVCSSQADINQRCGRRGAAADGIYVDADGVLQMALDLELTLRGVYDVFDLYDELIEIVVTANRRGIDFSGQQFVFVSSNVEFANGTATTTLRLRTCTNGVAGSTYTPPNEDNTVTADPTPAPPPTTVQPVSIGLARGLQSVILFNADGHPYVTQNFERSAIQGGPAWLQLALSLGGAGLLDAVQCPYMPSRYIVVTDGATNAIRTYDDPLGAATLTNRKTLRATASDSTNQGRVIDADFGAGYIRVISYYGDSGADSGTWETHSTNNGATWSAETRMSANYNDAPGGTNQPGLFVSTVSAGLTYFGAYTGSGTGAGASAELFTLSGASGISTIDTTPRFIHRSFADGENTLYFGAVNFSLSEATRSFIYRKVGAGAAVDITPLVGGNKQMPPFNRGLHTCPLDANTVVAAVAGTVSAVTTGAVMGSRDKGATWAQIGSGASYLYSAAESAGNDRNTLYVWGPSGAVGYSSDFLAIDDRRGNLLTDYPSIGRNLRLFGIPA